MFDVVIAGAGPVGLYAAHLCESFGLKVAVLEEHNEIGKPKHCSGLISTNLRKFFPDVESWNVVKNKVNYAVLHSGKTTLKLDKKRVAAYVIDRYLFDRKLSEFVESKIFLKHKVLSIGKIKEGIQVSTNKGIFKGKILLACDGSRSIIRQILNVHPKETITGVFGMTNEKSYENHVDLYFDLTKLKDGFFWKIPRGEKTEYGVFGCNVKIKDVESFFRKKFKEIYGGVIPIGLVDRLYFDRVLLLGDAAGTTKPWSGGGVIYGLLSSRIACKTVLKAFENDDFSERVLKDYEKIMRMAIGKQIAIGIMGRKVMKSANNYLLSLLFKTLSVLPLSRLDMDFIF